MSINIIKRLQYFACLMMACALLCVNVAAYGETKRIAIPKFVENTVSNTQEPSDSTAVDKSELNTPKIVGGSTASRGEFPEFVQLFVEGAAVGLDPNFLWSWCGGTLISPTKILTAASCIAEFSLYDIYALPKFYTFNDNIQFTDLIPLSTMVTHPSFNQPIAFDYDVTVLTMSQGSNAKPAKIYAGTSELVDFTSTIIGTGFLSESGPEPTTLQKLNLPIISNDECKGAYGANAITDRMMCTDTSPANASKGFCYGDYGGPLWVTIDGQRTQAGIVSWSDGVCADSFFYGVSARTSALIDFILRHAPDTEVVKGKSSLLAPVFSQLLLDGSDIIPDARLHCGSPRPYPCPSDGESNYFYYYSEAGDNLGNGKTNLIRESGTFMWASDLEVDNRVTFHLSLERNTISENWSLIIGAKNDERLALGKYLDARNTRQIDSNKLEFSGSSHPSDIFGDCITTVGEFEIHEIEYAVGYRVEKLAVNFKQYCDGSNAALHGYLRFNSNLPMYP